LNDSVLAPDVLHRQSLGLLCIANARLVGGEQLLCKMDNHFLDLYLLVISCSVICVSGIDSAFKGQWGKGKHRDEGSLLNMQAMRFCLQWLLENIVIQSISRRAAVLVKLS
jgi:hypothetical protein